MTTTSASAGPGEAPRTPGTTPDPDSTAQPPPTADPTRLTTRLRVVLAIVLIADVLDLMDSTPLGRSPGTAPG